MDKYINVIKKLAAKPVASVNFGGKRVKIIVNFCDGTKRQHAFDSTIRIFLISLEELSKRMSMPQDECCIPSPICFFDLLGYKSGDVVVFERNNVEFTIQFS